MSENSGTAIAKKPLWKRWWFIGLVILLLIAGLARMGKNSSQSSSATTSTTTEKTEKKPEPKKESKGLGVGRSKFAPVLESKEVGFKFKEGAPADAGPRWIGTSDAIKGGFVEMIGESNNLQKIEVTAIARSGESDNTLSIMTVVAVANLTNEKIGDWVKAQIKKNQFHESFSERESFSNAKVKMVYKKDLPPMLILTIEAR